mgnify:CR=1 FL=1
MKKSLIETLLTETPPEDYLQKEAEELKQKKSGEIEPAAAEPVQKGLAPEWVLLAMMAGLIGTMMGIGYLLIF